MTTGITVAVLLLVLCSNFVLCRMKGIKNKKVCSNIHKILGVLLIVVICIHMILTLSLIKQRPISMYVLGILMLILASLQIICYVCRNKMKLNWLRLHKWIAIALIICVLAHVCIGIISLKQYQNAIEEISIDDIDLSTISNGSYIGECDAGYVYAKVQVQVWNGKIEDVIIIEHRTERGKKAEEVAKKIVEQQKVPVDTVSGATNSSKVIERAVCNALVNQDIYY